MIQRYSRCRDIFHDLRVCYLTKFLTVIQLLEKHNRLNLVACSCYIKIWKTINEYCKSNDVSSFWCLIQKLLENVWMASSDTGKPTKFYSCKPIVKCGVLFCDFKACQLFVCFFTDLVELEVPEKVQKFVTTKTLLNWILALMIVTDSLSGAVNDFKLRFITVFRQLQKKTTFFAESTISQLWMLIKSIESFDNKQSISDTSENNLVELLQSMSWLIQRGCLSSEAQVSTTVKCFVLHIVRG